MPMPILDEITQPDPAGRCQIEMTIIRWMRRTTTGRCRIWVKMRNTRCEQMFSALPRWSQPVDATLYLRGKRWSVGWNEDFIEVLLRQRRRSYGIAGSAGS